MIEQVFSQTSVIGRLRSGPLGPHMDTMCGLLIAQGYAKYSLRLRLRLLGKFSQWLEKTGLGIADLDEQKNAEFLADPAQRRTWVQRSKAVLRLLLDHLRGGGILGMAEMKLQDTALDRIEREFAQYLTEQRGVSQATVKRYLLPVRCFLGERFGTGPFLLCELNAADVSRFILGSSRIGGTRSHPGALRSFFRFLRLSGQTPLDLAGAVLPAAHWRLSGVPKSLPAEQVEQLLESCDRSCPMGQRDYAVLLLLARLGLRAGEIAAMRLEDLDWRAGELTVRGKGRRQDRLPILHKVGVALSSYLHHARPRCATRRVFVGVRAPHRELSVSAVSEIVHRSLTRVGLCPRSKGAHLLRHSLATEMLRRDASLSEIGEILRHRQPSTTEIYAKVDFESLRTLAQPWPGGRR